MIRIIKRYLYILQLENYDLHRFLGVVIQKPFSFRQPRQKIVWTAKLIVVFVLAVLASIAVALNMASMFSYPINIAMFALWLIILFLAFAVVLAMAVIMLWPVDFIVKQTITVRARSKIREFKNLKVIGITGSYGKTTMKEVLAAILDARFKVLKTADSVNTPVGIARLILKNLTADHEIFIVEMGAYTRGEIKALCEIAQPDIAVVTGINEAHLERFGSMENTIKAKFEIAANAKTGAAVILNQDNDLVMRNYKNHTGARHVYFYSRNKNELPEYPKVPFLGEYIWGVVNACVIIARKLGMTDEEIRRGIADIKPIPHRLQLMENANGVTVIDDSYNGNPDGVREAIKVLAGFTDKRKIYITPGLVEAGERKKEIHNEIGRQLASVADIVILIRNSVTPYIAEKLDKEKIIWFNSAVEAHAGLANILKPGDVILFQNDWPDNYL